MHMPGTFPEEDPDVTQPEEYLDSTGQGRAGTSAEQERIENPSERERTSGDQDFTQPPQDEWILNGYDYSSVEYYQFFVTYIDSLGRWYRLNIALKMPSHTNSDYDTFDFAVSEATLHSASDASSVIYDWICNKLRYALLRKTTTSLYIGTDLERGLMIQLAEGEREVFRLLGLMPV